jgi:hypothetical protein
VVAIVTTCEPQVSLKSLRKISSVRDVDGRSEERTPAPIAWLLHLALRLAFRFPRSSRRPVRVERYPFASASLGPDRVPGPVSAPAASAIKLHFGSPQKAERRLPSPGIAFRHCISLGRRAVTQKSPPPMPPCECPPPPAGFSSFGFSAISASVVSIKLATDAAFCSALRTTLTGSMTPSATRSPYLLVWALKPKLPVPSLTFCGAAPAGRRPRRYAPAGAPTTPKPRARRRARSCSASPARELARGRLRGEVGVVVIVPSTELFKQPSHGRELTVVERQRSALTSIARRAAELRARAHATRQRR